MLVMKGGIPLLVLKSIIVLETCRNSEWFERVARVDLVLKQVSSIRCEVYPLVLAMLVVIPLRETDLVKVLVLLLLEWQPLQTSHLQIALSSILFVFSDGSIFRNESETKDDDSHKFVAADDEVAEGGYYTIPPIQKVASTASVPNFVVSRKGYGSISFKSPVDLTGITSLSVLREIVEIERGRVAVYPDESKHAPVGTGLNVPAEVIMENLRPSSNDELQKFTDELRSKPDTEFVSYDSATGTWIFNVQHFSVIVAGPSDAIARGSLAGQPALPALPRYLDIGVDVFRNIILQNL